MELENVTQLATGKQRVIYHVRGAKDNVQCLEEDEKDNEKRGMEEN